ncbi:MAG: flagellar motor switch protein FliG, partial [Burkholderiales bacterium]
MATQKAEAKDAKADKVDKPKAGKDTPPALPGVGGISMTEELAELTSTQRAAVLMLLLGEQQASEIIRF